MDTNAWMSVGKGVPRIDVMEKAAGAVKYVNDFYIPEMLHAKLVTSTCAHANIVSVDTTEAWKVPGVRAIVTGDVFPFHMGPILADRYPLAYQKVRYYGEPIAIIVADSEYQAKCAANQVIVHYDPLPIVNSPSQAMLADAPLVHETSGQYQKLISDVHPVSGTNIGSHIKIRKGDVNQGFAMSEVTVENTYAFNLSDHAAIEPRCARVQISPNGTVLVYSCTQSPFSIKKLFNQFFNLEVGKVVVHVPLVGGAFGGKGSIQLEPLCYLASQAVGGKLVKLAYEREQDLITAPTHIGLEARVRLGATKDGSLVAAHYTFLFDCGAYTDQAAGITRAAAIDCTGPYNIENVWCDSYCVYTNHPYVTSFRGYGHPELTFAIDRTMDMLAKKLGLDPVEFRLKNAIQPGDSTPTQVALTANNIGDVKQCLERAQELIQWGDGPRHELDNGKVRAKGVACIWKTSTTSTNAQAGAILTVDADGSVNLNCASIELGQGSKTILAQILAERLKMDINKIHVTMEVNTQYDPHQWRTVASSSTFLAGRAVIAAADDAIVQLTRTAGIALECSPEDLTVGGGRVFLKSNPEYGIDFKDIALGYHYPNGHAVEGQVIARGKYVQRHLTPLDKETGFGKPGPWWTVGAQAIEVEFDPKNYTYEILKAVTVLDGGTIINPVTATQQMRGGMYQGISLASSEAFEFDAAGAVLNPQFRTYKMLRYGEQPTEYVVDFVQTPSADGPYGARGIGEYGVIGMSAALANSLSNASMVELNHLPLVPETIWKKKMAREGVNRDCV